MSFKVLGVKWPTPSFSYRTYQLNSPYLPWFMLDYEFPELWCAVIIQDGTAIIQSIDCSSHEKANRAGVAACRRLRGGR